MHIMRINLTLRYFDSLSSHRLRERLNERAVIFSHIFSQKNFPLSIKFLYLRDFYKLFL